MRRRQQAWLKRTLCPLQYTLQIERAEYPVFGGAERQGHEWHRPGICRCRLMANLALAIWRIGIAIEGTTGAPRDAGKTAVNARAAVLLAVPLSPRIKTPPRPGSTAHNSKAVLSCD